MADAASEVLINIFVQYETHATQFYISQIASVFFLLYLDIKQQACNHHNHA
jgi:hypothetical protein